MDEITEKNLEDVESTLREIKALKKPQHKRDVLRMIISYIFFPITLSVLVFRYIFSRRKMRLTTKTTIIFTVIFTILMAIYVSFILLSFKSYLEQQALESKGFLATMVVISVIMVATFIFIGGLAGATISNAMLKPIRQIITQIDAVDGDDLSMRLQPVDSQDELTELVQQINAMLESLERAFLQQSNFVSDASHELKTPLSVVAGYANLLNRWGKNDPAILSEAVDAIKRESDYMAKIIDQMLLLARLGNFSMTKQIFDLSAAVKEIVDGYLIINKDYDISFIPSGTVLVEADKNLLIEAVRAIIDNAIKYSQEKGTVRISVREKENTVTIGVKDNGCGIGEKDLAHIFDRFYRCDKTRGREKGSAGLGLTICKSIIEMMGGKIEVESKKGVGTEFKIIFETTR